MKNLKNKAVLVLADGTFFEGTAFGAIEIETSGELVFSTSMTGYVELLTDPSYCEQLLTLTCPEIGNCGVTEIDFESQKIWAQGLVVREISPLVSNWRATMALNEWLVSHRIPGIFGIDTRALAKHLRDFGSQMAILSTKKVIDILSLHKKAQQLPGMRGKNLSKKVSTTHVYEFNEGLLDLVGNKIAPLTSQQFHVVVFDFGVKLNILRMLVHHGCRLTVIPADSCLSDVLSLNADGIFLSNGPGDPQMMTGAIKIVKELLGKVPIFGICMGHQILSLATGLETYKLKFGHRGTNQPVMGPDKRVMITSQNHGFAARENNSLKSDKNNLINLSDNTNEGIDLLDQWAFGVQYHPEGAPGPHDGQVHFKQFVDILDSWKKKQQ
ncbi:MAG: glutamine-hydrolyzing carbamoyl-phosphate synthase small subunit [bacterium]|nr:glutamine-hydrolyzing carbamoyl-phosphate synthase small subunit [bacterium]